jgi:hypothetical protein
LGDRAVYPEITKANLLPPRVAAIGLRDKLICRCLPFASRLQAEELDLGGGYDREIAASSVGT